MPRAPRIGLLVLAFLYALGLGSVRAQQFGRNKVEYEDFDFKIFDTEHFSIYHYSGEEESARIVARLAERWYARLSRVLEHKLSSRQPLILYGSQPEFAQTNVVNGFLNEGIGGVTESARRRIVMPFAPTLGETDRILGHEIAHAFQFDIGKKYRGGLTTWPLWGVEGMAQYLALGASDTETAMWLRDAVRSDLLPHREQDAARKFSPYRYGHAVWAYLAGRYGDRIMADVLKEGKSGSLPRRLRNVTGVEWKQLFDDWRAAAHQHYASATMTASGEPLLRARESGRLYLGPALSPNGRQAIFFSERDRLSLDLFLADTTTGRIEQKLATTAASARFESLQAIRSSGAWSPDGKRFVFAAIDRGQPTVLIFDMARRRTEREIKMSQFGQVLTPSWSPDGKSLAFAALSGGLTDLYTYELATGRLKQLTRDAYSDLQPVWSPDGRRIAFVTDRFSTNLSTLTFGPPQLALLDVGSDTVQPIRDSLEGTAHSNPQWSADGAGLFFVADPDGIANVYRLDLASGLVARITEVPGGVAGLTPTSPVLSVARDASILAFTTFRKGKYEMDIRTGAAALAGERFQGSLSRTATLLPPNERVDHIVEDVLEDSTAGLPDEEGLRARSYSPNLFLEALGPPYISSGSSPFGTFVRGGGSLLFSDLLGERKLATYAQAGNRLRDLALGLRFLNREHRWNWGVAAEVQPSIRRLPRSRLTEQAGQPALTRETQYFERTQFRAAGQLAYPFNQTQRIEFEAGVRHIDYRLSVHSTARSLQTGKILSQTTEEGFGGRPATVAEAGVAFVRDSAVFGPTSPIFGGRSRFEVTSTFGELSLTRVLLDHRVYLMPVKPYTVAARVVHLGQYGRDSQDPRLVPIFLGSRQFVHGYGWNSLRCEPDVSGECGAYDDLLASRFLVGNLELRVPIMGMLQRELRYGPVPAEAFVFADSGYVWAQSPAFTFAAPDRRLISSFGIGARLNAFGLPLEIAAVRALSAPARGWSFDFSFRPGF
jgi:hypothetical protein